MKKKEKKKLGFKRTAANNLFALKAIWEGSHAELLEADGKYAEMFRLQSEKYEDCKAV